MLFILCMQVTYYRPKKIRKSYKQLYQHKINEPKSSKQYDFKIDVLKYQQQIKTTYWHPKLIIGIEVKISNVSKITTRSS